MRTLRSTKKYIMRVLYYGLVSLLISSSFIFLSIFLSGFTLKKEFIEQYNLFYETRQYSQIPNQYIKANELINFNNKPIRWDLLSQMIVEDSILVNLKWKKISLSDCHGLNKAVVIPLTFINLKPEFYSQTRVNNIPLIKMHRIRN